MADSDVIRIPVELDLTDTLKFSNQLREILKQDFAKLREQAKSLNVPLPPGLKVKAQQFFEVEGAKYKEVGTVKEVKSKTGELVEQYSFTITEIGDAIQKETTLQNQATRLRKKLNKIEQDQRQANINRHAEEIKQAGQLFAETGKTAKLVRADEDEAARFVNNLRKESGRGWKENRKRAARIMGDLMKSGEEAQARVEEAEAEAARASKNFRVGSRQAFKDTVKQWQDQLKTQKKIEAASTIPGESFEQQAATFRQRTAAAEKRKRSEAFATFRGKTRIIEDPAKQLEAIEAELATATGHYAVELTRMSQQVKNRIKIKGAEAERNSRLRFQNTIMTSASAAIGLFGTAGFPVLNVAFAAMSGNVLGAAIAGAATIIGELTRALIQMSEEAKQTAKSINFVSLEFKISEGRMKAAQAVTGLGAMTAEKLANERSRQIHEEALREGKMPTLIPSLMEATRLTKQRAFQLPEKTLRPTVTEMFQPGTLLGSRLLRTFVNEFMGISGKNTEEARKKEAEGALRTMRIMMGAGGPGVENDPYQVWLRMQNAALDVAKQEEMRIARETLEQARKDTGLLQDIKENTAPMRTPGFLEKRSSGVTGTW